MNSPIIRVTEETLDVLEALLAAGDTEVYGWNIIKRTNLGGPTLYKILERLHRYDMLTKRWEELEDAEVARPRRRMYRMTAHGKTIAAELLQRRRMFVVRALDPVD